MFMGLGWLLAVFQTRSSPRILPSIGAAHRCGHQPFLLRCGTDLGAYGGDGGQQLQSWRPAMSRTAKARINAAARPCSPL